MQSLETDLIVEGIYRMYGIDFRDYAKHSLERRLVGRMKKEKMRHLGDLLHKVVGDPHFFSKVYTDLSVQVTEMFRDVVFFNTLTTQLLPLFENNESIKVWAAGCASGEEVYSLAILFHEAGLSGKTQFYATDMNSNALDLAKTGKINHFDEFSIEQSYVLSGGERNLIDYIDEKPDGIYLKPELLENIVFSDHNLVHDQAFGEMDLIICRNVLIYFNDELKQRVISLFMESLVKGGFIGLGLQEGLHFTPHQKSFVELVAGSRLYQWVQV